MRSSLMIVSGIIISGLIVSGFIYNKNLSKTRPEGDSTTSISSPIPPKMQLEATQAVPSSPPMNSNSGELVPNTNPDLTVDANGLSKATVVLKTTEGMIKFKFYTQDAPKTVTRIVELITKGFYNGLVFHRVVPGFVIQGGDPVGDGTGGSGQKLNAEFNNRRHIEGTVAMARAGDPNSADSQFYISLGTLPHLDHSYTVFGQVIEGMDVAKRIKVGDKMMQVIIQ